LILETKTTKKPSQNIIKKSLIILGVLFVLSSVFLLQHSVKADNAPLDCATPPAPNLLPPGNYIYSCSDNTKTVRGATGPAALNGLATIYTLYIDKQIVSGAQSIEWKKDGSVVSEAQNKPVFRDEIGGAGSPLSNRSVTATVVKDGKTIPFSKDPSSIDSAPNNQKGETEGLMGFIYKIIQGLVLVIAEFLWSVTHFLLIPIIRVILDMKPHDSSFSAVILGGWVFVRNLMNIVFILAMLVIALATLFQVDDKKYGYKHLIPELVLMALLVNFSLVIAQLILGVADTVQAQFLPNNQAVLDNLAYQMMVRPTQIVSSTSSLFKGSAHDVVASIFYLFFAVAAFFSFAAIAAFLVIRVVALWILLLLSPVAYGLRVIPDLHHQASEWWTQFLKYAFFTPILGFFLHIAASLTIAQANYLSKVTEASIAQSVNPGLGQFVELSLSCITIIIFLGMGLKVASGMGIAGASAVVDRAKGYTLKPFKAAGGAGVFAAGATKDYGVRLKNQLSSKLTRDADGKLRGGLALSAATALRPKEAFKNWLHEGTEKNEHAAEIAKAGVTTVREYGKSGFDNKADVAAKSKIHDAEIAPSLKIKVQDAIKVVLDPKIATEIREGNEHTIEKIANLHEAMAKNGRFESYVKRQYGGVYSEATVNQAIVAASHGNHEAAEKIAKSLQKGSKDSGSLLAASMAAAPGTARDDLMRDIVDNTDPAEINKLNVTGLDPNSPNTARTMRSIENLLRNSGRRDDQLTAKLQILVGRGPSALPGGPQIPT
jgi:hypothetical protein